MLLYQCAETETSRRLTGNPDAAQYDTTLHTYYSYDVPGVLVTVTRVGGSSGRVTVDYMTVDGNTNMIANGDNLALAGTDYEPVSGTLVFNDFEMSKTILIPIIDDFGISQPNRDFTILLTNAVLDASEPANTVSPPRLDSTYYQADVRILDADIDPKGESQVTNAVGTNIVTSYTPIPTNGVFNFQKTDYRVTRDVTNWWGTTPITVYVTRTGTNTSSQTVYWSIDAPFVSKNNVLENNEFPLQAGSDYAVPDPANSGGKEGGAKPDFAFPGSYSGTLTFPGGSNRDPQPIQFTVYDDGLTRFNKDFHIQLYQLDSNGNELQAGMVAETTVTILFDDLHPPAGSVDENYNADFGLEMAPPKSSYLAHPGAQGEVYGVALLNNNQALVAGSFSSYNGDTANGIALVQTNGTLDTSFNPGDGINVQNLEFINTIGLTLNNQIMIGGALDRMMVRNAAIWRV